MTTPRDILGERDPAFPERPTRVAEPSRKSTLPKRFYKSADVSQEDGLFCVTLDGKPVRTPGRHPLAVIHRALADQMATEWQAQEERIDPLTMPLTRLVNTAHDGVALEMQAVREDIIRYSGTDLLCYRAGDPKPLSDAQAEHWDPVLDWALGQGMNFLTTEGITHVQQQPETIATFGSQLAQVQDPVLLTALHLITSLTGSAIISLACLENVLDAESAWAAAHVDEDWNIAQWGGDEEAAKRRAMRFADMKAAMQVVEASK